MSTNKIFEMFPRSTLEAQVLIRLREGILNGAFEPGSQLNHVRLAEQFGVSRGPVRAALGKLEEEGLVNHVPHHGTFVTTLNRGVIEDLYNFRAVIEEYAAQLAVQNASQKEFRHLETLVNDMQQAARNRDAHGVEHADFSIHKFVVEISGNYFLKQTWSNLHLHMRWALADRLRDFHNLEEITESLVSLLEKFREKDAEGAGRICRAHSIQALIEIKAKWEKDDKNQTNAKGKIE